MKIKAKTSWDEIVTIIAFVSKVDCVYAVVIRNDGSLLDCRIENLTVLEQEREG